MRLPKFYKTAVLVACTGDNGIESVINNLLGHILSQNRKRVGNKLLVRFQDMLIVVYLVYSVFRKCLNDEADDDSHG
jgi:hypothetical protein